MQKTLLLIFFPMLFFLITGEATTFSKLFVETTSDKTVYKQGETIAMALTVLNQNSKTYQAQLSSSKIYDFYLYNEDQQLVWKWSGGKMFAMSLVNLKLEPKLPLTYVVTFNQIISSGKPLEPGKYQLVGEFCIRDKPTRSKPVEIEIRK